MFRDPCTVADDHWWRIESVHFSAIMIAGVLQVAGLDKRGMGWIGGFQSDVTPHEIFVPEFWYVVCHLYKSGIVA